MSPTVFREGPFSPSLLLEETRMHVHVQSADGEVKIWIEPAIEVAAVHGMTEQEVTRVLGMVRRREGEIRRAWDDHFAG